MAAPHISGLAALAWTASPNATPLQIRQALLRSSRGTAAHTKDFNFGAGRASATNLVDEARTAPGLKIRSPRYGATSNTHDIEMRIEARDRPVHWQLKYVAEMNFAGLDLATGVLIGAGGDVPAGTSVTPHQSWSPPETGNFGVILEATVNGEKYYDTTLLRSP
jgi:hypothetical protein